MTEEEGDLLHNITNQYWHDFSELVNSTLLLAPPHLRDFLEQKLQESSSVYGRDDVHAYEKDGPHPYILTRGPCRICAEHFDLKTCIRRRNLNPHRKRHFHPPLSSSFSVTMAL